MRKTTRFGEGKFRDGPGRRDPTDPIPALFRKPDVALGTGRDDGHRGASIFTPGEGSQETEPRIETDLAWLDEVRGFLVVVRPDAYIEEVRWDADGKFVAVSGPVENTGSLIARAIGELGSAKASCDLR